MALPAPTPTPSGTRFASPVPIIGPQYCARYPVDLAFVQEFVHVSNFGKYVVTDVNGTVKFKFRGQIVHVTQRQVLLDVAGNPVVTPRQECNDRWQAFRGESREKSDLIFSVKQTSIIQGRTKLHVFLANNTKEDVCDFKVEGSWSERSCVVYAGESSSIIAQMHKKETVESEKTAITDNFSVTISPNVDHAFIVALVMILCAWD
ncbi:protein LURP-one-related 15-like [Alnus glutinosa]|uniref:protein LURP-one-related 15-like n=1 Tax=Alnus glutinosa TaxID=3517 RepID=UPI002D76C9AD|nr:protein LURP-one-related 15-like [Alnus glutinosa]